MKMTDCGEESVERGCEPMNKSWIEGVAEYGEDCMSGGVGGVRSSILIVYISICELQSIF